MKIDGNAVYSIPFDNLSNTFKGKIGENVSCIRRNLERTDAEDFYYLMESGYMYDLTNCLETEKREIKTGFEKGYGGAGLFRFHFATNHPGHNSVKISEKKSKKDLEANGITDVELIGIFNDSSKLPDTYVLPTSSYEIRNNTMIGIASSGKTKYKKYKKDISDSYKLDE